MEFSSWMGTLIVFYFSEKKNSNIEKQIENIDVPQIKWQFEGITSKIRGIIIEIAQNCFW